MNMAYADQFKKYKEQQIYTLTPGELIVLLYDEAAKNINLAILNIQKKNIQEAHNRILKTEKIFLYLMECLDMSIPFSKGLLPMYQSIYSGLSKANIKKDVAMLEQLLKITVDLKDAWQKAEISTRSNESALGRSV